MPLASLNTVQESKAKPHHFAFLVILAQWLFFSSQAAPISIIWPSIIPSTLPSKLNTNTLFSHIPIFFKFPIFFSYPENFPPPVCSSLFISCTYSYPIWPSYLLFLWGYPYFFLLSLFHLCHTSCKKKKTPFLLESHFLALLPRLFLPFWSSWII